MANPQSPNPTTSPPPNTQPSSNFFTTLSPELRLVILTLAFGSRTIHLNFFDTTPPRPYDKSGGWPPKLPQGQTKLCSTICRRQDHFGPRDILGFRSVADDSCAAIYPFDEDKKMWSEERLAGLHLGVLGWLLACRQAYVEGLDVLFSTNTFHADRPVLAASLSSFFPRERLARIRAMELKLGWRVARYEGDRVPFHERLPRILENLSKELPGLTHLSIAFQDNLWPDPDARSAPLAEDFIPWLEDKALRPLDRLAESIERLETFEVFFVSSVHSKLRKEKHWERGRNGDFRPSFWWGLDGSEECKKGFWVCEGVDDTPYVCTYPPPPPRPAVAGG